MSGKAQAFDEHYGEQFQDFLCAVTLSTDMLEALGAMGYGESQVRLDAFYEAIDCLPAWVKSAIKQRYNRKGERYS